VGEFPVRAAPSNTAVAKGNAVLKPSNIPANSSVAQLRERLPELPFSVKDFAVPAGEFRFGFHFLAQEALQAVLPSSLPAQPRVRFENLSGRSLREGNAERVSETISTGVPSGREGHIFFRKRLPRDDAPC